MMTPLQVRSVKLFMENDPPIQTAM